MVPVLLNMYFYRAALGLLTPGLRAGRKRDQFQYAPSAEHDLYFPSLKSKPLLCQIQ